MSNLSIDHYPGYLERKPGYFDLQINDRPGVVAYRLWASTNPEHLYGERTGTGMLAVGADNTARQLLFRVDQGKFYVSSSVKEAGHRFDEQTRGITRMVFNLQDFFTPAAPQPLPSDGQVTYFSVQQELATQPFVPGTVPGRPNVVKGATDTGDPILGPVLIMPETTFFSQSTPTILIDSFAPAGVAGVSMTVGDTPLLDLDLQNPNPQHIVFPRPTSTLTIRATDAVEGLLVSFGTGGVVTSIPNGESRTIFGSVKDLLIGSDDAVVASRFSIEASISLWVTPW